ncbi:unnamed protein product [Brassica oleracea var. botrytis]
MTPESPMDSICASEKKHNERAWSSGLSKGSLMLSPGDLGFESQQRRIMQIYGEKHTGDLRHGARSTVRHGSHKMAQDDAYCVHVYVIVILMLIYILILQFEEYSKMIYLDADIQVYDNIDDLFDMEDGYLHGVLSCFCEKIWSYLPLYSIGWCQYRPEVTWPAEMESLPPPPYFNAGMFVFEPNPLTYESLLHTLQITPPTPFAEQDFLNMFFAKVFKPAPPVYNLILSVLWRHPGSVNLETVKVVHYCPPGAKPWRYTGEEPNMDREDVKMLIKQWWDIYNDESLDFKAKSAADLKENLSVSTIIASVPRPSVICLSPPAPPAA